MRFGHFRVGALALGLASLLSVVVAVPGLAATSVVTVTPSNMQGWFFCDDQASCLTPATATGSMVVGPNPAPMGVGSANLRTANAADGQALILNGYQGTKLASVSQLQYSTYRSSVDAGNNLAISSSSPSIRT